MEEKVGFYYCYVPGSGGAPQQRHKTIEDAKMEALRLSKKTAKTCEILQCVARTTLEPQIEELVGMTYDLHDVTGADWGYMIGQEVAVLDSTNDGFDVATVVDRKLFDGKHKYQIKFEETGKTSWVDGAWLRAISEALAQKPIFKRRRCMKKTVLVKTYDEFKVGQKIRYIYLKALHEVAFSIGELVTIDVTDKDNPKFTVFCDAGDDCGSEYVFSLQEMRQECQIAGGIIMAVKIKNMDMPKSCFDCKFRYKRKVPEFFGGHREIYTCFITGTNVYGHCKTREQDCPLAEDK